MKIRPSSVWVLVQWLHQNSQVLEAHDNEVWFLQFSHNGRYLASASKDLTAILWEVVDDGLVKLKHTLTGHQKPVSFVAWSPDDSMLLTCGNEESVKLWDTSTGECKHTFSKPNSCFTSCAWFPDGNRFVSGGGDKSIYMWNLEGQELESWKGARMPRINDLAITLDGSHMVIRVWFFISQYAPIIYADVAQNYERTLHFIHIKSSNWVLQT
jgi:WD40 repeat protein